MAGHIPDRLAASSGGAHRPFVAAAAAAAAAASFTADDSSSLLLGCSRPLLAFDAGLLRHAPPTDSSHPERPERAAAVMGRLMATGLAARCKRHILDCYIGPPTYSCAAKAAGAAIDVAVAVARGQAPAGAAIIRPPGHHAEGGLAMGFCYFNNAAVAARAAQREAGVRRVLILDWDVHHGNGTQAIFEDDPDVLFMSIHRYDRGQFFPGTGSVDDVGAAGAAAGRCVNVPWDGPGAGDADYIAAFTRLLLPIAYEFSPELVIVSAGFDAAAGDPLGGCQVTPACYGHMTSLLLPLAPTVEACVRVLVGEAPARLPAPLTPTRVGLAAVAAATAVQASGLGVSQDFLPRRRLLLSVASAGLVASTWPFTLKAQGVAAETVMYDPFAAAASLEFNAGSSNMASAVAAVLQAEQLLPPPPLQHGGGGGLDCSVHFAVCEAGGSTAPPCTITGGSGNAGSGSGAGDAALLASFRCQLQAEGSVSGEMPLSAAPTLSSTFSM
eukprot:gene11278-11427_t